MTFQQALEIESKRAINVINVPVTELDGYGTYIGPTKVWFHELKSKSKMIPTKEIEMLKKWKSSDTKFYSGHQTYLSLGN